MTFAWPKPIAKLLSGRGVRFLISGAALTLLAYLIFAGLLALGLHYLIASTAAWVAGIVVSYFLNKGFTFELGRAFVWREFLTLAAGYGLQFLLASLGYVVLIDGLGFQPTPAFLINVVIVAGFSFLFMQFVVFRRKSVDRG
jgi:putative flippase GtrA